MLSFISKYCVQNDQLMIGLKNDTENEILLWENDSLVKALAINSMRAGVLVSRIHMKLNATELLRMRGEAEET